MPAGSAVVAASLAARGASTQHLKSPPKPCHSLPPPSKPIPRFPTRVQGSVRVVKGWGGAHRCARTLGGTGGPLARAQPTAHPSTLGSHELAYHAVASQGWLPQPAT